MSQWKLFWQALRLFPKSIRFVRKNGLNWVYFASLTFAIILVVMLFLLKGEMVQWMEGWIINKVNGVFSVDLTDSRMVEGDGEGLFSKGFRWILNGALHLMGFWVQLKLYKPLVLIILSPVFAWLMEQALVLQGWNSVPFAWGRFFKSVWRGMKFAVLLTILEWAVFAVLAIVMFVMPMLFPVFGLLLLVAPVISFVISSWFFGAAIMDYAWELEALNSSKSIRKSWVLRGAIIGVGVPLATLTMVPLWTLGVGPVLAGIFCVVMGSFVAAKRIK